MPTTTEEVYTANEKASPAPKVWSIDADASLQAVLDDPECPSLFRRALTGPLSWQARNETTVRRALASPHVAPQWAAALLALGATLTTDGGEEPTETKLPLPKPEVADVRALCVRAEQGVRWGEARVARTPADEPIVAAVAVIETDGDAVRQARVALTGVWPEPARLAQAPAQLVGNSLEEINVQAVAEAVEKEVAPRGDFRGSAEYRRAMARVMTRRALEACLRQEVASE